jgi:hypothetical protein
MNFCTSRGPVEEREQGELLLDYSKNLVTEETMALLFRLLEPDEANLDDKIKEVE